MLFSLIEHVGGILSQKLLWFVKKFGIISSPNQLYNWNWQLCRHWDETEWTTLTTINFSTENIRRWKTAKIGLLEQVAVIFAISTTPCMSCSHCTALWEYSSIISSSHEQPRWFWCQAYILLKSQCPYVYVLTMNSTKQNSTLEVTFPHNIST